ncbi:MAG: hypothetical protein ABIH52_00600 [Candidatus Aenigmatarchaeota archaeon]|nr:hypothetical protein [Nanoarchaeota archaeon]
MKKLLPVLVLFGIILVSGCIYPPYQPVVRVEKNFEIPMNGATCINGKIRVLATNIGTAPLSPSDFYAEIDDEVVPVEFNSPLVEGKAAYIIEWNCDGSCSEGAHNIYIVLKESNQVIQTPVFCN